MTTKLSVRRLAAACAIAVAACVTSQSTLAQTAALPKGADLLAKYVAAIGGADAFKAIKSTRIKGTIEMPAQGINGTIDAVQARPSFMRQTATLQGIGTSDTGSDGKIAWTIDPISGPSLLTGAALAEAKAEALFDSQLFGSDYVKDAATLEKLTFNGVPAYKVKVITTFGTDRIYYIDASSSLMIGTESVTESPMGPVPTTTKVSEYKKFGAILQPTKVVQTALGFDQVIRMTSIEFDNVPMSAFDPPPAVKALIK